MRYWKIIIVGSFLVFCVIICSFLVFFWSKASCPIGTFSCSNSEICVLQKNVCNFIKECPNGEDEDPTLCMDLNGSLNVLNRTFIKNSIKIARHQNILQQCNISDYPVNCKCKMGYHVVCKNVGFKNIPQNISTEVTHLVLPNNSIHFLSNRALHLYQNLQVLHLEGNQLTDLKPKAFHTQRKLMRLLLMRNNLTTLERGVFDKLHNLAWLFLQKNKLETINANSWQDLKSLEWLDLSYNKLTFKYEYFAPLLNLNELFLGYNQITIIKNLTFAHLFNLELLNLQRNKIEVIEENAFFNLRELKELNLYGNKLTYLYSTQFTNVPLLNKLFLGNNPFHQFPTQLFYKLENLASLNLDEIDINDINMDIFKNLTNLKSVYFKKYYYCSFAPTVPRCRPLSDGVSSTKQLLEKPILRYATWVTSFVTCFGNILVIWGRHVSKEDNKVLNFVIRNLAGSDFLMGVYLLIIAFHDMKFRDVYNREAHNWMSSWLCTLCGVLAMTSSEVSVLLLVFMSVERFLLISIPFGNFSYMDIKTAWIAMIAIWVLGIGFAVIPMMALFSSTRFYGINGLCFPLYIDEPYLLGWKYSALIIFGINTLSLLIITVVYCAMFVSIWNTRKATTLPINDYEFAIRFFFIVLTDISCWLPIILIKLLALFGTEISEDLYSWLVVFILPINSAVNPLLYTFTTIKYRSKLSISWTFVAQTDNFIENVKHLPPQSNNDSGSTQTMNRSAQNSKAAKSYN